MKKNPTPYIKNVVPRKPEANLKWRLAWREDAAHDLKLQADFRQAAFEDVLFFFNAFAWCFEPRSSVKIRPFCTWEHQDPAILAMDGAIDEAEQGYEKTQSCLDVVIDKSRGQGATWMYLMICLRRWLRDDLFSAGLVTRNESLVDSQRDPDTLMWKLDWMLGMLPHWMMPDGFDPRKHRNYSEHSLMNPMNGASIVGYSATGDVARGGRKTVFCLDELGTFKAGDDYAAMNSTQHVANCRILVSTFLGDSGAYYDSATQAKDGDNNAVYVALDWKDNPTQNRKLYTLRGNTVRDVDPKKHGGKLNNSEIAKIRKQHVNLQRRGYKVSDKVRNIWYNGQCLRAGATPRGIAQELDRDPHGSVSKIFDPEIIKRMKDECAVPPLIQGRLVYDRETAEVVEPYFVESESGELKLWRRPGLNGEYQGVFAAGGDISAGTAGEYSSNSTISVTDKMTGENVAEWASNAVPPTDFAYVFVAICRWFNNAELIPEVNFRGNFLKVVMDDLGYTEKLYYRETEIKDGPQKITKKPGFWMANDDVKLSLFEDMQQAMATGAYIPRSKAMLDECLEYEYRNGKIVHIGSTKTADEGGKGKAHGDRVIGAALSWLGCTSNAVWADGADGAELSEEHIPEGSMAARLRDYDDIFHGDRDPWGDTPIDVFTRDGIALAGDEW